MCCINKPVLLGNLSWCQASTDVADNVLSGASYCVMTPEDSFFCIRFLVNCLAIALGSNFIVIPQQRRINLDPPVELSRHSLSTPVLLQWHCPHSEYGRLEGYIISAMIMLAAILSQYDMSFLWSL